MIPLLVAIVFVLWLIVPEIFDLMGYKQQHELDVYDRWVDVQLVRRYGSGYKGIS